MIDTQAKETLLRDLYLAADVDGVLAVMDRIEALQNADDIAPSDTFPLYRQGFQALQDLTIEDDVAAEDIIVGRLLPLCLDTSSDPDIQYEISKCRDTLRAWLDQYSDPRHGELRSLVLDKLRDGLSSDAMEAACYTITAIGYRRADIVDTLHIVVRGRKGADGDPALCALIGLGVPEAERGVVLRAIRDRAMVRRSSLLVSAIYFLADPSSIPVLQTWLQAVQEDEQDFPRALLLQALARIADRADGDTALQDRVWAIIQQDAEDPSHSSGQSVYYNSSIAPACESPRVVSFLLGLYGQDDGQTGLDSYRRYLLQLRLQECVRPRHLEAWTASEHAQRALGVLREDARTNSEQTGIHRGVPGDVKVGSWDLLLRLRDSRVFGSAGEALTRETGSSVRYEICEMLACFRLPAMPPIVWEWVATRYELTDAATREEGIFRGSAIDVVHSAGTRAAFDTLIVAGLSIRGDAYRDVAEALSSLAVALTEGGDASIASALLTAARDSGESFQRAAASVALSALAARGTLPADTADAIESLLSDTERQPYERSMLLRALDSLEPGDLPPARQDLLFRWARDEDNWLGWRSLEILAQRGLLERDGTLMREEVGLEREGDRWVVDPSSHPTAWGGSILGVLYRRAPAAFRDAVADSLRSWEWGMAAQLLAQLRLSVQSPTTKTLPRPIADALLARLVEHQDPFSSETDLFDAAAEFVPERLATEIKDDTWATWRPEARVAFADALGGASYDGATVAAGRAVALLQSLTRDAYYTVRRAAYRALGRIEPETLQTLCDVGSKATRVDVRRRAAEGCIWLGDDDRSRDVARRTLDVLLTDEEPAVRDVATRARAERRERLWAVAYLDKVCAVDGMGRDVLQAWAYGQALMRVGDDVTIRRLERHLQGSQLPPHVRHWLKRIDKAVRQRWDKVTSDWPEPWTMLEGRLDAGTAEVETADGQRKAAPYVLWSQPPRDLDEQFGSWGGIAEGIPMSNSGMLTLHFDNGQSRRIAVRRNVVSNVGGGSANFVGDGPYPL